MDSRWGARLSEAAFVLLLCCVAGRCFVQELQFRLSPLRVVLSPLSAVEAAHSPVVSTEELARVSYAVLLLAAGALAAAGAAIRGRLVVRRLWLGGLVLAFAAAAMVSAVLAADRRSGLLVWLEQTALASACFSAVQLCGDRRRWRVLLSVLLALGIAMAATGLWQFSVRGVEREEAAKLLAGSQPATTQPAGTGPQAGSRAAEMLEQRLREDTPTGYLGLANTFASLLILLLAASAGVAADAIAQAVRAARGQKRAKGEIPAPTVAAGAAVAAGVAIFVTLALTRSRAGIACAALALVAGAGIGLFRRWLARHWKKAVAAALAGAILLGASVGAYGLRKDSLPGKSMTFRWFYWTASAQIIREHPLWGVGGGNFPDAYLRVRRAEAEEEVKDPHNVVMHALTQFGLAGGLPYLAMIVAVLVCLARPASRGGRIAVDSGAPSFGGVRTDHTAAQSAAVAPSRQPPGSAASGRPGDIWVGSAVALAVLLSRVLFGDLGFDVGVLVFEAVWPAAVFAGALFLATWVVGVAEAAPIKGGWTKIAVAVGAAAFVLHNLTEFGLWTPGVALVFWVGAGACLAHSPGGRGRDLSRLRWRVAGLAIAAVVVPGVVIWRPTLLRTIDAQRAADLWHDGHPAMASQAAARAAEEDALDDLAASDAARVIVASTPPLSPGAGVALAKARHWADQAVERNPAACSNWLLSAALAWYQAVPDTFRHARRTMGKDPDVLQRELLGLLKDGRLVLPDLGHLEYARGRFAEASKYFTLALERDPNSSFLRGCLGDALWREGRREEAIAAWREAAARFPAGPMVEEALRRIRGAVACNPADAHLRLGCARMLCEAGEFEPCLSQIAKVEEIDRRLIDFARRYPPPSKTILSPEDRTQIEMLKARAEAGAR